MLSQDRIMGTKEVADYLGVSPQAFANLKNRYLEKNDFPIPFAELAATPIYDRLEIEKWADAHQRNYHATDIIGGWGAYKTIAFVGRPRVGKSFLVSEFVEESVQYRSSCSKPGDDYTQCAVQHCVREDITEPHAVFHSKRKDDQSEDPDGMDGMAFPLVEEVFEKQMDDITDYLRKKKESGEDIGNDAYIEIFARPSNLARAIMKACNLKTLIITDTPGVSENYSLVPIEKADLVALVIADSNKEEARKSYEELVTGLAPLVAASNVCFLYRISETCDDEEEYEDLQERAKEAMSRFSDYFAGWKGSIIKSSMNILQPTKNVLCIPSMKMKKSSASEEIFVKKFQDKIIEALTNKEISDNEVAEILKKDQVDKTEAEDFVRKLLNSWNTDNLQKQVEHEYTLEDFKAAKHDRVKSCDNYRLLFEAGSGCRKQLSSLYAIFEKYTAVDYSEDWKQALIKYVYAMLTQGIKADVGLVSGGHPFEDITPVTMYVIESILADDILENVVKPHAGVGIYNKTLREHGVTSNSWGYVKITETEEAVKKLNLISQSGLDKVKASDSADLVWSRYVMGLQKLAESHIYDTLEKIYG